MAKQNNPFKEIYYTVVRKCLSTHKIVVRILLLVRCASLYEKSITICNRQNVDLEVEQGVLNTIQYTIILKRCAHLALFLNSTVSSVVYVFVMVCTVKSAFVVVSALLLLCFYFKQFPL